ncbi:type II toxin-antitoxin system PemK/MazF family toxin [Paracoccus sp. S-4012]|uniref:type II toxin-antitoxin system PemK/MazF family toxin n=1 Tax=Paracoccus sp. S-4012 TaxID=2665648 RepID=UPI00351B866B
MRVPFPYTDAETRQHRPALVVAQAGSGAEPFLIWVVMITSAENRGWPGDVEIADSRSAGLPAASVVRTAKIATIDLARAEPRGRIAAQELSSVRAAIAARLDMTVEDRTL